MNCTPSVQLHGLMDVLNPFFTICFKLVRTISPGSGPGWLRRKNFLSGHPCPEGGIESVIPRCQATFSTCQWIVFERLNSSLDLNIVVKNLAVGGEPPKNTHTRRMKFANMIMQDPLQIGLLLFYDGKRAVTEARVIGLAMCTCCW